MYRRILVALDGSVSSTRALMEAVQLASLLHSQLRLISVEEFVSLLGPSGEEIDVASVDEATRAAGQRVLERGAAAVRAAKLEVETALVAPEGRPVSAVIVDEAAAWPADLIVMGTHGRHGLGHLLLGSAAEGVLRNAPAPLLLVRHPKVGDEAKSSGA